MPSSFFSPFVPAAKTSDTSNQIYLGGQQNDDGLNQFKEFEGTDSMNYYASVYEDSGGGVTLSGGEALTWPDFCEELLVRLHEEGIDTCIETEAHVLPEVFQRIAAHLDHMLVDLKHVDATKLRTQAGARADLMLENLAWALANHPDVLPRTPVIPDFNDTPDDARAMARWLRAHGGTRVQLLPFHNFGESKYALLDMPYALRGVKNLHPEDLEDYRQTYLDEGIDAFF